MLLWQHNYPQVPVSPLWILVQFVGWNQQPLIVNSFQQQHVPVTQGLNMRDTLVQVIERLEPQLCLLHFTLLLLQTSMSAQRLGLNPAMPTVSASIQKAATPVSATVAIVGMDLPAWKVWKL